ncbi:MAG: CocE/NonD family hydrolase [Vicinamibacterales bacterium]
MRDGVKLHTVLLTPKAAKRAPILLTRTPYNATRRHSSRTLSSPNRRITARPCNGSITHPTGRASSSYPWLRRLDVGEPREGCSRDLSLIDSDGGS